MSNWTQDEVNTLKQKNGGGNAVARLTWQGGIAAAGLEKPTQAATLNDKKQFVRAVYIDKRFVVEVAYRLILEYIFIHKRTPATPARRNIDHD